MSQLRANVPGIAGARFWDRLEPKALAVFQDYKTVNCKVAFPKLKFWKSLNL
jgi:hypothetical protein